MTIPIRKKLSVLLGVLLMASFTAPAFADDHDWRDRDRAREHARYERSHHPRPYVTYSPGYVYTPPPVYYAPPPPPPVAPSFSVVIPLQFR